MGKLQVLGLSGCGCGLQAVAGWRGIWLGGSGSSISDRQALDHREVVADQGGEEIGEKVGEGRVGI